MIMSRTRFFGLTAGALAFLAAGGAAIASCSQTPVNVPVRTFELAQRVDVVCMQVNDPAGNTLTGPTPFPEAQCAPVAVNVNGAALQYHLFAAVTQVERGELAIVDLTAGNVVDEDKSTPGINFIPVGTLPTDVTVAPDAEMTFVSSADPTKPAIYGMPNVRILGNSMGSPPRAPLRLTDLFACALPQPPDALAIASTGGGHYVLVAMLRAWAGAPATIAAIDPTPLIEGAATQYPDGGIADAGGDAGVAPGSLGACKVLGAVPLSPALPPSSTPGPTWPDGVPYVDGGVVLTDAEPSLGPTCSAGAVVDAGATPLPSLFGTLDQPRPTAMAMRTDVPVLYVADGALPVIHVIDLSDPTSPKEQPPLLATSVSNPSLRVTVGQLAISPPTHDFRRYLYAIDTTPGGVMVFDITDPVSSPHQPLLRPHAELNPFTPPDRIVFSAPVATLAFVQHDWPLPSQVPTGKPPIDQYTGLLCNPNQNAHPNAQTFVDRGAYYRADEDTLIQTSSSGATGAVGNFPLRLRGIFAFVTLSNGTIVTIDVDDWDAPCRRPDPMTSDTTVPDVAGLTYGGPSYGMTGSLDVAEPAPSDTSDLDPYHAPLTYNSVIPEIAATTLESFFPVSAPNRIRSNFLLRNDPTTGLHVPNQLGPALLFDVNGSLLSTNTAGGSSAPLMLPTPLSPGFYDPTYLANPTEPDPTLRTPTATSTAALASAAGQADAGALTLVPGSMQTSSPGVRVSFDDPTAEQDQDWTVTYEGALPTVSNIALDIASSDGTYQTLTLATGVGTADASSGSTSPGFCSRGIEDWSIGQARAGVVLQAISAAGFPAPGTGALPSNPTLPQWTSDYVELTDDLLAQGDPYWSQPSATNDCWDGDLADDPGVVSPMRSSHADARYNLCATEYGSDGEDAAPEGNQSVADTFFARDFPILQAYDDHLVLGRFGWFDTDSKGNAVGEQPNNRVVVGPDPSNVPFLRLARCCFHHQATFKVRTGGEWLTVGSATGLLHHVQTDPGTNRCVIGCNPTEVLENARTFDIPWSLPASGDPGLVDGGPVAKVAGCTPPALPANLDRNSVLAQRNPMFSFVMWSGCAPLAGNDHTETARDMVWKFSLRGGFTPVTVSLSQNTTTAVSPQSMRFIDSLGQLAVVDGAQQGLVLIDLNTLQFAHNPYF
jgi:hypothetical protein